MRARPILIAAAGLAASGCSSPQDYLHTAGAPADRIAALGWFALLSFSATIVVMWVLIGWIAVRRRGSFAEHAPIDADGGQRWILIGGLAIPTAVLAILFVTTMETLSAFPMQHLGPGNPEICTDAGQILVTGHQWWFEAEYRYPEVDRNFKVTTELHIPVGKPVDVLLQTRDVIHSFWIPKLHGKVDLVPGQVNHVRIQADRPGVYEGECGEYCGAQHAHMRLQVMAQSQKDYDAWVEQQRKPAAESDWSEAQRGKAVFMGAACPLCHTVRGTQALGQVGPELTHVGSRNRIAGGMLKNDTANLEAWVTHAQSLKPGAQMPDLTQFTGRDLRALTAYLQSLR
jgi:cytochrome c oxidase subunit 2